MKTIKVNLTATISYDKEVEVPSEMQILLLLGYYNNAVNQVNGHINLKQLKVNGRTKPLKHVK